MEVEIRPEPSDDERAAILAALRTAEDDDAPARSRWWTAGLLEATGRDDDGA